MPAESSKIVFASTLNHTEAFLQSICCDQCRQPSDKLQFIGSSCKHVFCWTCIHAICDRKSFPLCPQCLLPVGLQHVKSASFADQLFQNILALKESLAQFTVSYFDRHLMLSLVETNEQRRTVEEFCSTQQCDEIKNDVDVHEEGLASKSLTTSVSNDVIPFTQVDGTVAAGTSVQNDVLNDQQLCVYDEPENFQFFKKRPRNTFGGSMAKKMCSDSDTSKNKLFSCKDGR